MENFVQNKYGYCFYEIMDTALVYNLRVHKKFRSKNKAEVLIKHVVNEIRWTGYSGPIFVEVAPESWLDVNRLKSFYERNGLTVI